MVVVMNTHGILMIFIFCLTLQLIVGVAIPLFVCNSAVYLMRSWLSVRNVQTNKSFIGNG